MLSCLLCTTFVECIASTTLLLLKTASIGIDCGDSNKISWISDSKKVVCSIASCKLRTSDAMVEQTICLIFLACQVNGQLLSWLSTRKILYAPTLLTPSLRLAWAASENAITVQLYVDHYWKWGKIFWWWYTLTSKYFSML